MGAMASPVVACPSCGTKNRLPVAAGGHPRCAKCKTNLPWLVDAGDTDFAAAIDTRALVVVDLWAPWCGPCRMMAPAYEEAARRLEPRVRFAKLNTDESPGTAAQYGIRSIPTLIVFKGGREVARQSGAMSVAQIVQWIGAAVD